MTQEELTQYLEEIAGKKTLNVSTSLERIKLLRNILANHANDLGLGINADPKVLASDDPTLEDIVKVYNTILKRVVPEIEAGTDSDSLVVDNKHKVVVAPGYYSQGFVVAGSNSASDQDAAIKEALDNLKKEILANSADPDKVLTGSKAVVVTENPDTNELSISYVDGTVGKTYVEGQADTRLVAGAKATDNTLIINSSDGTELSSKIPYFVGGNKEVQITVKEGKTLGDGAENVDILEVNKLPKGYYSSDIQILPVLNLDDNPNKVINVQTDKTIVLTSETTEITPSTGFDYIKNVNVSVQEGQARFLATASGNTVKLTPDFLGGWVTPEKGSIEANLGTTVIANADNSFTVVLPTSTAEDGTAIAGSKDIDEDQKQELIVTPSAGYYDGNTSVKVLLNDKDVEYITEVPDVVVDEGVASITLPTGIVGTPVSKELDLSTLEVDHAASQDISATKELDSKESFINITEGYSLSSSTQLSIKDASTPSLVAKPTDNGTSQIVVSIEKGGWAEGDTDVTSQFAVLAQQYANGLVDTSHGEVTTEEVSAEGQAQFSYNDLGTATSGIQVKKPSDNAKYFTSAKVDLSQLINIIDNI